MVLFDRVSFLGYALLDGFDLGNWGCSFLFVGKKQKEKDILINSIGPVWDGNEVWLVTGAGALLPLSRTLTPQRYPVFIRQCCLFYSR